MKLFLPVRASRLFAFFLILFMMSNAACYHYRVVAPKFDPSTDYQSKTVHGLFWGLVQPKSVPTQNCAPGNRIDEVRVSTNLGYSILNVVSLGIWCPMKLEWRCSKPCPRSPGDL